MKSNNSNGISSITCESETDTDYCSVLIRTASTHWFLVRNTSRIFEIIFQWFANNFGNKCVSVCAAKFTISLFAIPINYINLKYFQFDKDDIPCDCQLMLKKTQFHGRMVCATAATTDIIYNGTPRSLHSRVELGRMYIVHTTEQYNIQDTSSLVMYSYDGGMKQNINMYSCKMFANIVLSHRLPAQLSSIKIIITLV